MKIKELIVGGLVSIILAGIMVLIIHHNGRVYEEQAKRLEDCLEQYETIEQGHIYCK